MQLRHIHYVIISIFNGTKAHETININLSNKPIWISDLNVDRKVPILEFIEDGEIKVWLKLKSELGRAWSFMEVLAVLMTPWRIIISTIFSVLVESENIIKYLDETFGQCALTKQADKFKAELPNTPDDIVNFFMEKVMEPWYQVVYYNLRTVPKS